MMEEIQKPDRPPLLRIGITYNMKKGVASELPDGEAEFDDYDTILAIKNALEGENRRVDLLEATEDLPFKLADRKVDIVFNIAEGSNGRGREAQVPAILNFFEIPFTGSDETTLGIALDKSLTKRILATHRIRTPKYQVVRKDMRSISGRVPFPAIVKPNAEGSSKGISDFSIVTNRDELHDLLFRKLDLYQQDMLVEEYIDGREFTVGILGNGTEMRVFPPMEIIYRDRRKPYAIYSYEVKKNFRELIRYECPAQLPDHTRSEIENTARKIYEVLDCRDFARIDFRLSPAGLLYFIEINPLPGLAPGYSDYPMAAELIGIDYRTLLNSILHSALKRYGLNIYL